MNLETEVDLVQNQALSSILLWEFVVKFFQHMEKQKGPQIPMVLPVLAMSFHQETVLALHSRHLEGGLHLALSQNRMLVVDLQERIKAMRQQTMDALNVSFAAGLLTYDRLEGELRPSRLTPPFSSSVLEIKQMRQTASRLGYWFSSMELGQLCQLLRIKI